MLASHICKDLYEWIQDNEPYGKIHSIFKNSLNILSENNKLISVVLPNKPISPNSIKLESGFDFDRGKISIDARGHFTKDCFTSNGLNISYRDSRLWDKRVKLVSKNDTRENFLFKLDLTRKFILNKGNKSGIFSLMKFVQGKLIDSENSNVANKSQLFIKDRFKKFIESYINSDIASININSKKIIGFGQGLTPSMDDFLSGMMIANIYISHFLGLDMRNAYILNHLIVGDIEKRTTLISEEMLKSSSLGETNEDIRSLMIALVGTSTEDQLNELLTKVINLGHSSGTDILCGIYIGSCILVGKDKGE